jgi:hypothetical protein
MDRRQPTNAETEPRRRVAGYFAALLLGAAAVAAVALVATSGDGGETGASAEGAFGTHYSGLEDRRLAAGVPTMSDSSAGGAHIHPRLSVYVRGEEIPLPVNIGIDPSRPPQAMAGLHTHDQSGVIHVENAAQPTLGQFFEIWGVELSDSRLGPFEANAEEKVRMWVDGEPSQEFGDVALADGQQIVVAFGADARVPSG